MSDQGENRLERELVEMIRAAGPITFARFMELALYHPDHGYYTRGGGPWGRERDYVTSVDAGPMFPGLLLPLIRACWTALGSPEDYLLVDAGGGDGRFAGSVRRELDRGEPDAFSRALRPALADRCAAGRSPALAPTTFPPMAGQPAPGPCCVFANELLDALPVHLVRQTGGQLEEALVDQQGGGLEFRWSSPTTPEVPAYFQRAGIRLADGQQAAVNLEAGRWIAEAAAGIRQGHLVIIDYGYPAPVLFSPEVAAEPLRTYRSGREGENPLCSPGFQDITSMVDFSDLLRRATAAGFTLHCITDQYRLLQRLAERLAEDRTGWERLTTGTGAMENLQRGMALRALLSPEGISGSFRVLVLSRGSVEPLPLLEGLRRPAGLDHRVV